MKTQSTTRRTTQAANTQPLSGPEVRRRLERELVLSLLEAAAQRKKQLLREKGEN